jgi:hypothetical protein
MAHRRLLTRAVAGTRVFASEGERDAGVWLAFRSLSEEVAFPEVPVGLEVGEGFLGA